MGNVLLSLSTRAEVYALDPRVANGSSRLVVNIGSTVKGGLVHARTV